jgi:hypothetical protein
MEDQESGEDMERSRGRSEIEYSGEIQEEIEEDWEWEIQGDLDEICGDSKKIEGNREWDIQERYGRSRMRDSMRYMVVCARYREITDVRFRKETERVVGDIGRVERDTGKTWGATGRPREI